MRQTVTSCSYCTCAWLMIHKCFPACSEEGISTSFLRSKNELLRVKITAVNILRKIATSIQKAKFFSLMADEVTKASNKEQVTVCFCSVDETFEPQEHFVGVHAVECIKTDILVRVLKDIMLWMELLIGDCRGQCNNGAANMCGSKTGIGIQFKSEEPRAICIHCYGHVLNSAAGETVKKNGVL